MAAESLQSACNDVVDRLKRDLFGPANGEREIILGKPAWRYLSGILFPLETEGLLEDEDDEQDPIALSDSEEESDPAVAAAYDMLPASMGISFYLTDAREILCDVEGAKYEKVSLSELRQELEAGEADEARAREIRLIAGAGEESNADETSTESESSESGTRPRRASADLWSRQPIARHETPDTARLVVPPRGQASIEQTSVLQGAARVSARFRPFLGGHLVTVTLINATSRDPSDSSASDVESMLFQCRFRVRVESGSIGKYPDLERFSKHPEDEELSLVYSSRRTYGIGHGCAATWDSKPADDLLREIAAEPIPRFELKSLTNRIELDADAAKALDVGWLADPARSTADLELALEKFVQAYGAWVAKQKELAAGLEEAQSHIARRILDRQDVAIERMRAGIRCIVESEETAESFRIAQEAMFRQFAWSKNCENGPFDLGVGRVEPTVPPLGAAAENPKWFPFQLAFQLLALESVADPESEARNLVDVLWFPTGGGKTEAYLALAAFEMVQRRRLYQDCGTAVIKRYTLRLLTSQQFERCATLVSVLESMRKDMSDELGSKPFLLGLWVGGGLTPNRLDNDNERDPGARQWVERILDAEEPENPFLLRSCPRCGTRIVPSAQSAERSHYGVEANINGFRFKCPDTRCELNEEIPASVVDEDLFSRPPTFLIGTIDKFARMVWDVRSRVFLGQGRSNSLPPTLIIQDELHLIDGPLGSIAGGYEAAIDAVSTSGGSRPKYIASSATIQRAEEQCRALYARSAFVFPPSGLDASDSFFSREDSDAPGRTYLGVMGNGLYSSLTTLVQVSAAAAHAPTCVENSSDLITDSYWTQVIYHNSRQELGKTTTMLRDDVKTRLGILEPIVEDRRAFDSIEELSANLKGTEVGEALERLGVGYPRKDAIDAVACTNMISVGVDVSRLGLMLVKGQPKSTAEYIQATSRVGRDTKRRPPGVVVTIYNPLRPRDRSHYEGFQSYHHALYRAVEPSSVTPYSPPARDRTLHAALVLAMRHLMSWEEGRDASKFDAEDPEQLAIIEAVRARVLAACREDESLETGQHLSALVDEWMDEVASNDPTPLTFDAHRQFRSLLTTFPRDEGPGGNWPTLNSMRHVDGETGFEIRGQFDAPYRERDDSAG